MILKNDVIFILSQLESAGYEAFIVGGCVRDSIIGVEPKDWDIVTNATPDEIASIFSEFSLDFVGKSFGVIKLTLNSDIYDIATYRKDGTYSDSSRPDDVTFVNTIHADLSRRDFTMNAIAYNPSLGFIDPFNGIGDISSGVIRAVGDPYVRFTEDYLRMLRALRFSSVLNFEIEKTTSQAILDLKNYLMKVPGQRFYFEFVKLIKGINVYNTLMSYWEVFSVVIPELNALMYYNQNTPYHVYSLDMHTAHTVSHARTSSYLVGMAALLHDISKPDCCVLDDDGISHFYGHADYGSEVARNILTRLRFSTVEIDYIYNLIAEHDRVLSPSRKLLSKIVYKYGYDFARDLCRLKICDRLSHSDPDISIYVETLEYLDFMETEVPPITVSDLALNGYDLMQLGFEGIEIGRIKSSLLLDVLEGIVSNDKDLLMERVKSVYFSQDSDLIGS